MNGVTIAIVVALSVMALYAWHKYRRYEKLGLSRFEKLDKRTQAHEFGEKLAFAIVHAENEDYMGESALAGVCAGLIGRYGMEPALLMLEMATERIRQAEIVVDENGMHHITAKFEDVQKKEKAGV